jgi:hypothetical protein
MSVLIKIRSFPAALLYKLQAKYEFHAFYRILESAYIMSMYSIQFLPILGEE